MILKGLLATASLALALGTAAPAAIAVPAGGTLSRYSVHADSTMDMQFGPGEGPCATPGTVTVDQHVIASVAATQAGLSDSQVLALLAEDPGLVLRQVHTTTTGTAVYITGGHRYAGTFTSTFEGHFLPNGMYIKTGTFSLQARSETGSLLLVTSGGHDVDSFDGSPKMYNQHGSVRGCLSRP